MGGGGNDWRRSGEGRDTAEGWDGVRGAECKGRAVFEWCDWR